MHRPAASLVPSLPIDIRHWAGLFVAALAFAGCCAVPTASTISPGGAEAFEHASPRGTERLQRVGLQLYTVRSAMAEDFEGTLRRVAELGYDEVEFAGLFDRRPEAVKELLNELGLVPTASHVGWQQFRDDPAAVIDETEALGARYMVFAWMPEEQRRTRDHWKQWIARLNAVGRSCRERGLRLAYHNHGYEFSTIDGVRPYDLILEGIDRDVVELELDLYWAAKMGEDPLALFRRFPQGFPLLHAKDMVGQQRAMADLGRGQLDFASTFAQHALSGMAHVFVEHDDTASPWGSAEAGLAYLRELRF